MLDIPFWIDHSDISFKNLDIGELKSVADECCGFNTDTVMYSIIDGKVTSHCCTAASIMYYLDLYKEMPSEYIDLRAVNAEEVEEALLKLYHAVYMQVCNYCIPDNRKEKIQVAEQLTINPFKKVFSHFRL